MEKMVFEWPFASNDFRNRIKILSFQLHFQFRKKKSQEAILR